jgi:excisionase family DNA binding protein
MTRPEIIDVRVQKLGEAMALRTIMGSEGMPPSLEGWVGKKETAERLKISLRTLYSWMGKRWVSHMRIGRSVRYKLSAVDEAVTRRFQIHGRWND